MVLDIQGNLFLRQFDRLCGYSTFCNMKQAGRLGTFPDRKDMFYSIYFRHDSLTNSDDYRDEDDVVPLRLQQEVFLLARK